MQTVDRKENRNWDIDALMELPEIQAVLDERQVLLSEFRRRFTSEWVKKEGSGELPDVGWLNEEYNARIRELRARIREVAEAHQR